MFVNIRIVNRAFSLAAPAAILFGFDPSALTRAASTGTRRAQVYTYHDAAGNRLITGRGDLPGAKALDIPTIAAPLGLVAADTIANTTWDTKSTQKVCLTCRIGCKTTFSLRLLPPDTERGV